MIVHAGLIAAFFPGGWRGVLILGEPGAGKSDLALRCLDQGFRLVADDRTLVWACEGGLYGRAPDSLAGLMEIRGLGVVPEPPVPFCRIALSVRCGSVERMPEPTVENYVGLSLPALNLLPLESSAPAKLRRALQHLGAGAEGAYQDALAAGALPQPGGDSR